MTRVASRCRLAWILRTRMAYHHARFEALAAHPRATGLAMLELFGRGQVANPRLVDGRRSYHLLTLFPRSGREEIRLPAVARHLWRTLVRLDPQILAVNGWGDPASWIALLWARLHRRPVIVMSESSHHDRPRRGWSEAFKRAFVHRCAAGLAGGSDHVEYLRRLGLSDTTIRLGYNAVDNRLFASPAPLDPSLAAELPPRFFLCCARFVPKKNHALVLRALAKLRDNGRQVASVVFVGDGPTCSMIREQCTEADLDDHVRFLGAQPTDRLPALYQRARGLIIPSTEEQWGLVVNEAMAAGCPVIASRRVGAAREMIEHERHGLLIDPEDAGTLATALERLDADPALAQRLGRAGTARVAAYGPARFAAGLAAVALLAVRQA